MGYYFALNQSEEKLKHINRDEQTAVGLFYSSKQMARNCHYNYYKNCAECEKTSRHFPFNMLAIS